MWTKTRHHNLGRWLFYGLLASSCFVLFACLRPPVVGIAGHYLFAKEEVIKPVGGNLDKAITNLEYVVSKDPFYYDSLTLLGWAYYKRKRFQDAFQILKRALAVKPDDEIAWIALSLTQLRLGDDERGLESFKGGITLLIKVSKDGYRGNEFWDKNGLVNRAIRRAVLFATKGLKEKRKIIRIGEILLRRVYDEADEGQIEQELDVMGG